MSLLEIKPIKKYVNYFVKGMNSEISLKTFSFGGDE